MNLTPTTIAISTVIATVLIWWIWSALNWVWFRPKSIEKRLKQQGLQGNSYRPLVGDIRDMLLASGFANYDGDKWAKHRRIVSPAFNVEKLKLLVPIFCQCCDDMISKLESVVSSSNGSCELDIWPFVQNVSSDVLARAGFGSSYQEGKRVFELQREMLQHTMTLFKFAFIPGYRFLPTYTNRRMKAIDKEIRGSLMGIINRRLKAMDAGEPTNNDLLGILLESNYKESEKSNSGGGMSLRDVVEEVKLFYLAGQEANAELLVWTMLILSKHPDWQAKAREEVFKVFGNEKPDYDKLGQLKIVSMILQESLRLYPPVVMFARYLRKDAKLGELTIPAGVELVVPVSILHQEKEFWGDDAGEFKPERFSEGVSKATNGKVSYLPFGWGPRLCIGQNFGLLEAKIALSMILRHFSLELSPSYTHAPSFIITLQPERGAHIILRGWGLKIQSTGRVPMMEALARSWQLHYLLVGDQVNLHCSKEVFKLWAKIIPSLRANASAVSGLKDGTLLLASTLHLKVPGRGGLHGAGALTFLVCIPLPPPA
ncbi:Cytochrome P450 [Sesbania bispinosa]|nr:Cytochrome P450 [Sesbania bispinosa]